MANVNPLLLVGAVIGVVTALLVFAYASVKDKKGSMGFERNMADGEIVRRLVQYAKPYGGKFIIVGFLVLFSISYDIASPLIVGYIEELVVGDFTLDHLFASVAVYAGVLVFSMLSTYFQAVILQKVGQRIISDLREDLFTHIESLAHEQLNEIPVGKLVTRVTNDTNAIHSNHRPIERYGNRFFYSFPVIMDGVSNRERIQKQSAVSSRLLILPFNCFLFKE